MENFIVQGVKHDEIVYIVRVKNNASPHRCTLQYNKSIYRLTTNPEEASIFVDTAEVCTAARKLGLKQKSLWPLD